MTMKKALTSILFMLLSIMAYADEVVGTYTNNFDGSDYSVSVRTNDTELQYVYIYMATAKNTGGYFAFKGKHINEFAASLSQIRAKYIEWSAVAKEEGVTKMLKEFDFEMPSGTYFWSGNAWMAKGKLHALFIVTDGKPFISFSYSANALTNKFITETFYSTFSSVESFDKFCNVFDKSKMLEISKSIKNKQNKFK